MAFYFFQASTGYLPNDKSVQGSATTGKKFRGKKLEEINLDKENYDVSDEKEKHEADTTKRSKIRFNGKTDITI